MASPSSRKEPTSPSSKTPSEDKKALFSPRAPDRPFQDVLWRLSRHLDAPDDFPRLSRLLSITPTEQTCTDYVYTSEGRAERVHQLLVDWYTKELRHRLVEKDQFALAEKCWRLLLGTQPPAVSDPWQLVLQSKAVNYRLSPHEVRDWQFAGIIQQNIEVSSEETDGLHCPSVKLVDLLPHLRRTGRNGYKKFSQYIHRNSSRYVSLVDSLGQKKDDEKLEAIAEVEDDDQAADQADSSQMQKISTEPDRLLWQLAVHLMSLRDYEPMMTVLGPNDDAFENRRKSMLAGDTITEATSTTKRYLLFDSLNQFFAVLWKQFENVVDSYTSHFSVRVRAISNGILSPACAEDVRVAEGRATFHRVSSLNGGFVWQVEPGNELKKLILLAGEDEHPTATHTHGQLFWFVIDTSSISGFYEFAGMNTDDCHTGLFLAANSKAAAEAGKDVCLKIEIRKPAHGSRPSTFEKDFLFTNVVNDDGSISIKHSSGLFVSKIMEDQQSISSGTSSMTKTKLCLGKEKHNFVLETPVFDI